MLIAVIALSLLCLCMARLLYVLIRDREHQFKVDRAIERELYQADLLELFKKVRGNAVAKMRD